MKFWRQQLNAGRDYGNRGLMSDHIKLGGNELGVYISMFLSTVTSHGSATNDLLISTVIPILKSKNVNLTALTTVTTMVSHSVQF